MFCLLFEHYNQMMEKRGSKTIRGKVSRKGGSKSQRGGKKYKEMITIFNFFKNRK
jgi:hypothetical protein